MSDFSGESSAGVEVAEGIGDYLTIGRVTFGEKMIGLPPYTHDRLVTLDRLTPWQQFITVDRVGGLLSKAGVDYSACLVNGTSMTGADIGIYTREDVPKTMPSKTFSVGSAQFEMGSTIQRALNGEFMAGQTRVVGKTREEVELPGIHLERSVDGQAVITGTLSAGKLEQLMEENKKITTITVTSYDIQSGVEGTSVNGFPVYIKVAK